MSLTMQPNDSMRWIKRTIALLRSPNCGSGSVERGSASREPGWALLRPTVSAASSRIASSRRCASNSSTSGATRGIRALARSAEKRLMSVLPLRP